MKQAFGALVQQFGVLKCPAWNWFLWDIKNIVSSCTILHDVIVKTSKDHCIFNDQQNENNKTAMEEDALIALLFLLSKTTMAMVFSAGACNKGCSCDSSNGRQGIASIITRRSNGTHLEWIAISKQNRMHHFQ